MWQHKHNSSRQSPTNSGFRPQLEVLEDRMLLAKSIWSGLGANEFWTTPENWVGNLAPNPGDKLVFPAGASRLANTNDFADGTFFKAMIFDGIGYSISSSNGNVNRIELGPKGITSNAVGNNFYLGGLTFADDGEAHKITVSSENVLLGLTGAIAGNGDVRKKGPGFLQLGKSSPEFTGTITCKEGLFQVLFDFTNASVRVAGGSFDGGDGQFGDLTALGGTHRVLNTVNVAGDVSYGPASTLEYRLESSAPGSPSANVLQVDGQVTLDNPQLIVNNEFDVAGSINEFLVIDNRGTNAIQGVFKDLPENARIDIPGSALPFRISYQGGDGNDVVLQRRFLFPPLIKDTTLTPLIDEGGIATLSGRLVDENADDDLFLDVDWGDGSPLESHAVGREFFSVSHRYGDDNGTDTFLVHFTWRDDSGLFNDRTLPVTVRNVAPVFTELTATLPMTLGDSLRLHGAFSDPALPDSFVLLIAWGDGTYTARNLSAGSRVFDLSHEYQEQPGGHTVSVMLVDDDGGGNVQEVEVM